MRVSELSTPAETCLHVRRTRQFLENLQPQNRQPCFSLPRCHNMLGEDHNIPIPLHQKPELTELFDEKQVLVARVQVGM